MSRAILYGVTIFTVPVKTATSSLLNPSRIRCALGYWEAPASKPFSGDSTRTLVAIRLLVSGRSELICHPGLTVIVTTTSVLPPATASFAAAVTVTGPETALLGGGFLSDGH